MALSDYPHLEGRLRMAILTKGDLPNPTWNSFKSQDHKPDDQIIAGMLRRLERSRVFHDLQKVEIYCNKTNQLIREFETTVK